MVRFCSSMVMKVKKTFTSTHVLLSNHIAFLCKIFGSLSLLCVCDMSLEVYIVFNTCHIGDRSLPIAFRSLLCKDITCNGASP